MADTSSKVGVEFVVKGLATLKSALAEGTKGLNVFRAAAGLFKQRLAAIRPETTALERAFVSLGNKIKHFAQNIIKGIFIVAVGVLLRDAIRKVVDVIRDMIGTVVEAANEFQALEVRLNSFNMNALVESGMSFNEAMEKSIALTKEQLGWTVKLAIQSPYDATDIANSYSLARSYGFVDTKAKKLTDAITNFASGMGLGNESIERIVTNLGQMEQQGKITGTELRDLARGSFVPVNKILGMIAKNIGVTTEELNKMRKAGTTDPQWFIDAFIELAETDFAGAAEKMSRTLPKALGNLKDMFVGMPALYSIKPMFDAIGGGVADIIASFKGAKLDALISSFSRIGKALSEIVRGIFNLLPGTESVSDSILKAFQNIASWLQTNKGAIIDWVKNAITFLKNLAVFIKNDVIPVIGTFFKWLYDNGDTILVFGKIWLALQVGTIFLQKFAVAWIMVKYGIKLAGAAISIFGESLSGIMLTLGKLAGWIGLIAFAFYDLKNRLGVLVYWFDWWKETIVYILSDEFTWKGLGERWVQGIIGGLYAAAPWLWDAISWVANSAVKLFNSIFKMRSPSKIMFSAGENITKGLAEGITSGTNAVLGVTAKLAESVSSTLAGTKLANSVSSITSGVSTSKTSNYLSNTGEVMRSKLDTEPGGDPCAKGTAASCAAEKVASALGGIGSSISDAFDEYYMTLEEMYGDFIAQLNKGVEKTEEMTKNVTGSTQKLANYATEDLKNKSTIYATGISEINRVNTEAAKGSARAAITGISDAQAKATQSLMQNNNTFNYFMNKSHDAFLNKLNTLGGNSPNTYSIPPTSRSTSVTSTTNVTNNFGKGTTKGSQVTFDYESSKFWM